jgi:exopolyphosphatase/guanosine-5'-triphosphate,3'-diphosphate pyrophosphatase
MISELRGTRREQVVWRLAGRDQRCGKHPWQAQIWVAWQQGIKDRPEPGVATPEKALEKEAYYGALDLGTNNCRLLIAAPAQQGFHVKDAFSRIVRLGEGLGKTGALNALAMDRTIEALRVCSNKLVWHKVKKHRLIATEACRMASNGPEFIARVTSETGLELEIIDRETEARLAARGGH